jgi:pimeloyl-ACP methyl ester carboxylesterase
MTTYSDRRAAGVIAAVLGLDGLVHVYWAAGGTWPAPDTRAISIALLGIDVPFRAPLLLVLALTVWAGAGVVLLRATHRRGGVVGRLVQLGTAVLTASLLLRALLGCWWLFAPGSLPTTFYWLNLMLYTPLCAALGSLGVRLLAPAGQSLPRRLLSARTAAVAAPLLTMLALLVAAFGYVPTEQSRYSPAALLGTTPSRYLDTDVARFHYVRMGRGSPVVLLSPGSAWLYAWQPQIRALAATNTVYAVDLPGQGFTRLHSQRFGFDLDGMTHAIASFLDGVGLHRAALAGNSWSGGWALAFAQRHPDRVSSLALLAPSGLDQPDPPSWELLKLPLLGRALTHLGVSSADTMRAGIRELFVHRDLVTPTLVRAMWAPNTFADNMRADYELEQRLDWSRTEQALPTTRVRTLIIWGRQDQVLPVAQSRRFAALMPNADVRLLNRCGHALTLDCPGAVNRLLKGFWGADRR